VERFDQRLREALVALDLVVMAANDRLQLDRGLHQRLTIDISW